ncbi:hypothetical protein EBR66_04210, partial [bacterium]|nr:hypothetical protein [bacterium]
FFAAVFLSSFLLFGFELLLGKRVLPYFGGVSSVWAMCLFFFTTLLCMGYWYVYILTTYSVHLQKRVHSVAWCVSITLLLCAWWVGPVFIQRPLLGVPLTLTLWAGPVFFMLSTSPLLQYWYRQFHPEPYTLYAVSNGASICAVLLFPFVLEPFLSITTLFWSGAAMLLVLVCLHILIARSVREEAPAPLLTALPQVENKTKVLWVVLSALPAGLLSIITTQLTQELMPLPVLWTIPLVLYFLSFVLAFWGRASSPVPILLAVASIGATLLVTPVSSSTLPYAVVAYCALLFFSSLVFHGQVWRLRPQAAHLPLFYGWVSVGGMLGTGIAAFVPPLLFSEYLEVPLTVFATLYAILSITLFRVWGRTRLWTQGAAALLCVFGCAYVISITGVRTAGSDVAAERMRNFYGVKTVYTYPSLRGLTNGSTLHGSQFRDEIKSTLPTAYYTASSGVGRAFAAQRERQEKGALSVGVVGLGVGTLAAYCEKSDSFDFYEIDPQVIRVAHDHFSYLKQCAHVEIVEGDARVLLSQRGVGNRSYDILAIDAFSDDFVPIHLLTLEALRLYEQYLKDEQSILAVHVSSKYVDLAPVVLRAAAEIGFSAMKVSDPGNAESAVPSTWVLLTKDSKVFSGKAFAYASAPPPEPIPVAWTDDFASVVPQLYFSW